MQASAIYYRTNFRLGTAIVLIEDSLWMIEMVSRDLIANNLC